MPRRLYTVAAIALIVTTMACSKKEKPGRIADLAASKVTTIGINAYLWRASLDTVSFMPLLQTDSNADVSGRTDETDSLILDQDLRADALRVAASRQVLTGGQWLDAPVQAATVQKLEDIILTKARDLRRSAVAG